MFLRTITGGLRTANGAFMCLVNVSVSGDKWYIGLQVKQGEGWVTKKSSWFSFGSYEVIIYACLGPTGEIYDVTESSVCHGMLQSAAFRQLGPDSCKVWLSFGPPDSTRHRGKQKVQQETAGGRKNRRQKGRRRR